MRRASRSSKGCRQCLTKEEKEKMVRLFKQGVKIKYLAERFEVVTNTVSRIIRRRMVDVKNNK